MSDTENSRRDLWRAVIEQSIKDATTRKSDKYSQHDRKLARVWLSRRSADLDEVCGLADREPDAVIREAAAIIAADDLRLANGKRRAFKMAQATKQAKPEPKRIELDGLNLTIAEWSVRTGFDRATIASRLKQGWDSERILTQPTKVGWAWKNTHQLQLGKQA